MRIAAAWVSSLAISAAVASGEPPPSRVHFEGAGPENGPLPEVVTAICRDRAGFLWIGSRHGLYLYDGYSPRIFKHDPDDPGSISDHSVRTIFEDSRGGLWIGTNAGGLERLDRARWTFEHFRHDSHDVRSLSHDSVYEIAEAPDGALWVATQQGLNRLDPQARTFERLLPGSYVAALRFDRQGRLWIGTIGEGLSIRAAGENRFRTFRTSSDPRSLSTDEVFEIAEDSGGGMWIGTSDGLDRWDEATSSFRRESIRGQNVTFIVPVSSGRVWVATFGAGLADFDPQTGTAVYSRHDPLRRDSLADDRIVSIVPGREGALWIGTWGGGLQKLAPGALELAAAAERAKAPAGLEGDVVAALLRGRDDSLWIGSLLGRVVRRRFAPQADDTLIEAPAQVLCLLEDRKGRIWAGTSQALHRFDPRTGERAKFVHDPARASSLGSGYVRALLEDRDGRVWVGTGEGGVQHIADDGSIIARFVHDPANAESLSDDYVTAMRQDRAGTIWVGTRSGGLNALDPATQRVAHYLGRRTVTSILEDRKGRLWVGSIGAGLHLLEHGADGAVRFRSFGEAEGLVENDVVAILEDDDGSLWVSTRQGIARFTPDSSTVANYGVADGVSAGEFEIGSAARTSDTLFFGGISGMVGVPAGMTARPPSPSPLALTSIRSASGEIRGEVPSWELSQVELPYGAWLAVEMAVLDFEAADRHLYAYRLGDDALPWVELGPRRSVTFTDLAPGRHRFSVRGRNGQGVWTETRHLDIRVRPPFWMTDWFRIGSGLALVGVAFGAHRLRTASLARHNRQLLELQVERERAQNALRAAYDRLGQLTRRFEAAKEDERKRIARELHDDLGPSLTAVIINLQLLADPAHKETSARRLADSTELIDRIVQQIRDLSLALRPPLLDEMGLVAALRGYLETLAERTGLDLSFRGDPSLVGLPAEVEITAFRVAQEALTNVVRHAHARRVVTSVERRNGRIVVAVEDDGVGFDVAAKVGSAATGNAVGLLGMQERVRLLGGELSIDSTPGRGTRVRAELPVEGVS